MLQTAGPKVHGKCGGWGVEIRQCRSVNKFEEGIGTCSMKVSTVE